MEVLERFKEFEGSKKQSVVMTRGVLVFSLVTFICSLVFAWCTTQTAYNKIVVVERSGEYLKTTAEEREELFVSLVKTTCSQITKYANSFGRQDINDNQTKALFLGSKDALDQIFALYKQEGSYHEAVERGVVYSCELENVSFIGDVEPYQVEFTSILSIFDNDGTAFFRIRSNGKLKKIRPDFPNNITGLFFVQLQQTIEKKDE